MADIREVSISNTVYDVKVKNDHALKSYLDDGTLLTDTEGLADVTSYAHSTFDLSKFTVVGSPTITDDGIASGFSSSNDVVITTLDFADVETFTIEGKFYHTGLSNGGRTQLIIRLVDENSYNKLGLNNLYSGGNIVTWLYASSDTTSYSDSNWFSYTQNEWQSYKFVYDGTNIKFYLNGTLVKTSSNVDKTWLQHTLTLKIGSDGASSYAQNYTGKLNIKDLIIIKNGVKVFSGNKTGIDTIKANNYTVVGSPTITDDGIFSNTTATQGSSYLSGNETIDISSGVFTIKGKLKVSANNNNELICLYKDSTENNNIYIRNTNAKLSLKVGSSGVGLTPTPTEWTYFIATCDGVNLTLKTSTDNINWTENTVTPATGWYDFSDKTQMVVKIGAGVWGAPTLVTTKYIDLNALKIYVDGDLVYQPCLKIPYTQSKTGSKIVDSYYRDRVSDMYSQFGYAPYYTLNEGTNFTLPMGEIYGFIGENDIIEYVNGTSGYRIWVKTGYCEQWGYSAYGSTTRTITLAKTMKDTNYSILVSCNHNDGSPLAACWYSPATTGFSIFQGNSLSCSWRVFGYLAEGQW